MSDQNNGQVSTLQRPTDDNPNTWKTYWEAQGCPWRTEPEIDTERQKYLAERRVIVPDIKKGIYPFKDIRLSRADVEWLLATHENGRGPVEWNDAGQRQRQELDLRGAFLQQVNLRRLPLAKMHGGLTEELWYGATQAQRDLATAHLEEADLRWAHLECSALNHAHMEGANLREAHLEDARLFGSYLGGKGLPPTNLREAFFDSKTQLGAINICNEEQVGIWLSDVHWEGCNLTGVEWVSMKMTYDEYEARKKYNGKKKGRSMRLWEYRRAVRANHQLTSVLQNQGLGEEADRFAYRAQLLQRKVCQLQRRPIKVLLSWFLDLLAGYGYRPGRSVIWYLVTIFGFALAYFAIGHLPFFPDAFVFSLTSFHGRGFFPGLGSENSLHNPLVILAAFEAVVGLLIEISFIATFTQRFFGR